MIDALFWTAKILLGLRRDYERMRDTVKATAQEVQHGEMPTLSTAQEPIERDA